MLFSCRLPAPSVSLGTPATSLGKWDRYSGSLAYEIHQPSPTPAVACYSLPPSPFLSIPLACLCPGGALYLHHEPPHTQHKGFSLLHDHHPPEPGWKKLRWVFGALDVCEYRPYVGPKALVEETGCEFLCPRIQNTFLQTLLVVEFCY